jgi:hypothetical protein
VDTGRLTAMRPSGYYASYRGDEYPVGSYGRDDDGAEYVDLVVGARAADSFVEVRTRPDGRLVARVRRDALDRYERVETTGTFAGKSVVIWGDGDPVPCTFVGDPQWARAHGFAGSQHDGWRGEVRRAEITDVHESATALP